jgi:hypothetical protein
MENDMANKQDERNKESKGGAAEGGPMAMGMGAKKMMAQMGQGGSPMEMI